jgi:probable DNA metabolism protein
MDECTDSLFAAATGGRADGDAAPGPLRLAVGSFGAWRDAARALLQAGVAPDEVQWSTSVAADPAHRGATAAPFVRAAGARPRGSALAVPRALLATLACAACCRVEDRWSLLYRVLWRRQRGDAEATSPTDPDGARLRNRVALVRAELERARTAIRFLERAPGAGAPRFVGWCEPAHDILAPLARHFRERLARVTWMIATPDASVLWDGAALHHAGPPLRHARAGRYSEAPWLAYYRNAAAPLALAGPAPACGSALAPAAPAAPEQPAAPEAAAAGPGPTSPDNAPATLAQCRRCSLWEHATQPVGGMGAMPSAIMLVGEQPGDREDVAGLPFVGPAGMLLDRALAEARLGRNTVYITNAVKHFKFTPRGKRRMHKTPAQREVAACRYWLDAELASVRPTVMVALGGTALKAVLDDPGATLKELVGTAIGHRGRWVVATYHPAYVLRLPDPAARQQAFAALVDALRRAQVLVSAHPPAPPPSSPRAAPDPAPPPRRRPP